MTNIAGESLHPHTAGPSTTASTYIIAASISKVWPICLANKYRSRKEA